MKRVRGLGLVLLVALALSLLSANCGESNIQSIRRLQPEGRSVRARLARIAEALPPPGSVKHDAAPVAFLPRLTLDYRQRAFNADVLMEEQLTDPDRDLSGRLDLMLSPELLSCLMWTGPKNPLDESVWDDRTDLGKECERAFSVRYLIVVRTVAFQLPQRIALEVFVVDFAREQLVAALPLQLSGRYSPSDVGREPNVSPAASQLRSDAFVAARCEVARRVGALPGARVDLSESWSARGTDPCRARSSGMFIASPEVAKARGRGDDAAPSSQPVADAGGAGAEAWRQCSEPADAGAPASLRDVDWCNREYVPGLVALRAGRGEMRDYVEPGGIHDTTLTSLRQVEYADLDGDGAEEALVALDGQDYVGEAMHSARYTWLFVFEWERGAPRQSASDRVGRAEELEVSGSEIRIRFREGNQLCRRRYRVRGAALEQEPGGAECAPLQ